MKRHQFSQQFAQDISQTLLQQAGQRLIVCLSAGLQPVSHVETIDLLCATYITPEPPPVKLKLHVILNGMRGAGFSSVTGRYMLKSWLKLRTIGTDADEFRIVGMTGWKPAGNLQARICGWAYMQHFSLFRIFAGGFELIEGMGL